jgi:hypothetical protein
MYMQPVAKPRRAGCLLPFADQTIIDFIDAALKFLLFKTMKQFLSCPIVIPTKVLNKRLIFETLPKEKANFAQ